MPTFEQIMTAEFDFAAMKELFLKVCKHPYVDVVIQKVTDFTESSPFIWAAVLLVLSILLSFAGKKLLSLFALVGCAGVGFLGGAVLLAPRLAAFVNGISLLSFISIDPIVVGIICAVVAAILFLPLYFAGFAAVIGYIPYLFVYPVCATLFDADIAKIIGLGVAVGVVVLAFIFRKWVEMGVTAVAGGYIAMWAAFAVIPMHFIVNIIIWCVVAVAGLVVQIKTRRRY